MEEKIENKTEDIRDMLNSINDTLEEIDKLADVDDSKIIKNIDNFLWRLSIDNYELSEKIKPFIEEYLKFYNN